MTTLTIKIPEQNPSIIEEIRTVLSRFQGISFDFQQSMKEERVKNSLRTMCSEISSGSALKSAKPLSHLYAEIS